MKPDRTTVGIAGAGVAAVALSIGALYLPHAPVRPAPLTIHTEQQSRAFAWARKNAEEERHYAHSYLELPRNLSAYEKL